MAGAILLVASSGLAAAQRTSGGTNEPITPPNTSQPGMLGPLDSPGGAPDGPFRARIAQDRVKMANASRQKRLQDDVRRMISLTNELKAEMGNGGAQDSSADLNKKLAEIEKLAHDVQNHMKE